MYKQCQNGKVVEKDTMWMYNIKICVENVQLINM